MEKQLLSEIESVAKAYGKLEEENVKKVQELAIIEDEIIKLQAERVKYSQIFTALNKSKDAHAILANALNKQIEKQLAYIKQMTEREKNLTNQVVSLDDKKEHRVITLYVDMLGSQTSHQQFYL